LERSGEPPLKLGEIYKIRIAVAVIIHTVVTTRATRTVSGGNQLLEVGQTYNSVTVSINSVKGAQSAIANEQIGTVE